MKQPAQSHPAGQRQTRVSNLGLPGLRPQLYTWTSYSLTEPSLYHSWYHPCTIPALYLDYLPQPQSHPCTISVDLWPRESREYSTCRVSRERGLLLYFSNSLLKIIPFLHLFIFPFTESLSFYLFFSLFHLSESLWEEKNTFDYYPFWFKVMSSISFQSIYLTQTTSGSERRSREFVSTCFCSSEKPFHFNSLQISMEDLERVIQEL